MQNDEDVVSQAQKEERKLVKWPNQLTEILQTQYPIIQAPMAGGITTSQLVASVSNAGALGSIGAGYMTPDQLRDQIREVKQLTSRPFGVNLFIPEEPHVSSEELETAYRLLQLFRDELHLKSEIPSLTNSSNFEDQINVVLEEKVPVCSFTFGVPRKEVVTELKQHHITVLGTATTVKEALINEELGMDAVVVQGSEAGGHRGTFAVDFKEGMIGLMALVPQVVDHVHIPVIAAGGIMDGRGLAASLVLGAQGVQMGTAFLTCLESGAHDSYKEAVLNSDEDQTVITTTFSGKPARGIRNRFITEMEKHTAPLPAYPIQNTLTKNIRKEAAKQNRPEFMSLWSGQNPRLSKKQSADELISAIVDEVQDIRGKM